MPHYMLINIACKEVGYEPTSIYKMGRQQLIEDIIAHRKED